MPVGIVVLWVYVAAVLTAIAIIKEALRLASSLWTGKPRRGGMTTAHIAKVLER